MKRLWLIGWCVPLGLAAQEPTFMEGATHPGAAQLYQRALITGTPWAEADADTYRVKLSSAYGLTARHALLADVEQGERGGWAGSLRLKHRFWQRDTGPIDTWRASIQIGGDWSEEQDAGIRAGVVSTTIRGRHGLNIQLDWRQAGPTGDRVAAHGSHLYRWYPARYTPTTRGAWYSVIESLNTYTDTDAYIPELVLGALYEARRWAAEIAWRSGDLSEGPERERQQLAIGARYLW